MTLTKKSVADTFINWKNSRIVKSVDYSRLLTLFFNNKEKNFSNKDIKDAFSMMIDYQKLADFGEIARGPIPPISWAYNSSLKTNIYDIDTATKIVKNGIEATESAQLNLMTSYDYYDAADSIAGEIKKTGLKVDINMVLTNDRITLIYYWFFGMSLKIQINIIFGTRPRKKEI